MPVDRSPAGGLPDRSQVDAKKNQSAATAAMPGLRKKRLTADIHGVRTGAKEMGLVPYRDLD